MTQAAYDEAQRILDLRNKHRDLRRSNASDYLLSGLIFCDPCGKRFVGTAATGRSARYEYYTCFSRQRYGRKSFAAERLPADELDDAIVDALDLTFGQSDIVQEAVAEASDRLRSGRTVSDKN